MVLNDAQREMSAGYNGGATGILVSGLVWLVAGFIARQHGIASGFTALFFGGMLIFPLSLMLSRVVFKAPSVSVSNGLNRLAMEGTVMLFAGIIMAYALIKVQPNVAFPAMALAMGARYFTFRTLYDELLYWPLGGLIMLAGGAEILGLAQLGEGFGLLVGGIEIVFAVLIFVRWRRTG